MSQKIRISNSKLIVEEIIKPISEPNKFPDLKYKVAFVVDRSAGLAYCIDNKLTFDHIAETTSKDATWYVIKEESKINPWHDLDEYERTTLMFILSTISSDSYLDLAEKMILATGDKKIIDNFYGHLVYNCGDKWSFKNIVKDIKNYKPERDEVTRIPRYDGRVRYSVYKLINDLVKDKAKLLLDEDLVGKYNRISQRTVAVDDDSSSEKDDLPKWYQIIGKLGNMTRPNISLTFRKGNQSRNLNLIRDGLLNVRYLAVRVSDNLARRLRRSKCFSMNLVRKNDYLLDLTELPVVSRAELGKIPFPNLVFAEQQFRLARAGKYYVEKKTNKKRDNKDSYSRKVVESTKTRSYTADVLKVSITGEDRALSSKKDTESAVDCFISGKPVESSLLRNFLTNITNFEPEYWEKRVKVLEARLRDYKFRLMMRKDLPSSLIRYITSSSSYIFTVHHINITV